jgi:magnesium-transporting ATPase (P-type)
MTDENFLEVSHLADDVVDRLTYHTLQTKNVALQGTHCVSGSGVGLVIQTGDNTVL